MTKAARTPLTPAVRNLLALGLSGLAALSFGYGALAPLPPLPGPAGGDKLAHLVAFAAIAFPTAALAPRHLLWLLPAGFAYGGAIELIQPYFGRGREFLDLVFDGLGLIVGAAAGLAASHVLARLRG